MTPRTLWIALLLLAGCGASSAAPEDPPAETETSEAPDEGPAPDEAEAPDEAPPAAGSPGPAAAETREVPRGRGTLLIVEADAERYFRMHGYFEPEGYFTPTDAEFDAALAALGPALAALPRHRTDEPADADDYFRRALGVTVEGRRQVFVAGYCEIDDLRELFVVADGGDCYFEGFYDLGEGAYRNLRFHGEA